MYYKMEFEENPRLTTDENEAGRENIDDFNQMFNATCSIIATFKGASGQRTIEKVISLVIENPELQQFLFEFYFNIKAAERLKSIYNEKE